VRRALRQFVDTTLTERQRDLDALKCPVGLRNSLSGCVDDSPAPRIVVDGHGQHFHSAGRRKVRARDVPATGHRDVDVDGASLADFLRNLSREEQTR